MSSAVPVLSVNGLRKLFNGVAAVDGVSFALARGETIALLGPSGCGKTSSLRMVAGFERPDEGVVAIRGRDVTNMRPYERNIGILFQDYALFPHMTVAENVAFGPLHRGLGKAETGRRVERYLALVHMSQFADRHPISLSGGQQQRVALARALATEPEILLLDEPLSALDAKMREGLRTELKQIIAQAGVATIIVTHDQEEALSLADRVLVMRQGKVLQDAPPDEIYNRPADRFVAEFVGRSIWLKGRVELKGTEVLFLGEGGISFPAPVHLPRGRDLLCFLRPEDIVVTSAAEGVSAGRIGLRGVLRGRSFLGQHTELQAEAGSVKLTAYADQRAAAGLAIGDELLLSFSPDRLGLVTGE